MVYGALSMVSPSSGSRERCLSSEDLGEGFRGRHGRDWFGRELRVYCVMFGARNLQWEHRVKSLVVELRVIGLDELDEVVVHDLLERQVKRSIQD